MKNADMDLWQKEIRRSIKKNYKPSAWSRFKDAMKECSYIGIFLLVIVMLIKNPISLSIIGGLILLVIVIKGLTK